MILIEITSILYNYMGLRKIHKGYSFSKNYALQKRKAGLAKR